MLIDTLTLCLEFILIIFYTVSMNIFEKCALRTPDILVPNKSVDLTAWSVIACDQYTQDTDYWSKAAAVAKDCYSTLHMILPEVYLNTFSDEQRKQEIIKIQKTMQQVFLQIPCIPCFILSEKQPITACGKGLLPVSIWKNTIGGRTQKRKYAQPKLRLWSGCPRGWKSDKEQRWKCRILCCWSMILNEY